MEDIFSFCKTLINISIMHKHLCGCNISLLRTNEGGRGVQIRHLHCSEWLDLWNRLRFFSKEEPVDKQSCD